MALAGSIKLKTFIGLVVGGLALAGVGAFVGGGALVAALPDPAPRVAEPIAVAPTPQTPVAAPAAPVAAPAAPAAGGRAVDTAIFAYQGKNLGADKKKDVTKGRPYKVNLYMDAGKSEMNRAKVDLDRDDKWDEKFTFDGATVTRQVAPADDENYTQTFHWDGQTWVPE